MGPALLGEGVDEPGYLVRAGLTLLPDRLMIVCSDNTRMIVGSVLIAPLLATGTTANSRQPPLRQLQHVASN